jgi:hydroxyacylglutathione hydrolase
LTRGPRLALLATLAVLLVGYGLLARRAIGYRVAGFFSASPPLEEPDPREARARWIDDYFIVEVIDADTFAIGEPRYWQANFSYLILGNERALLFDSGPGVRDIRSVVDQLTDLPTTVLASHVHYDHLGNLTRFDRIALADLPALRTHAPGDVFRPSSLQFLGRLEGMAAPTIPVDDWLAVGSEIDLGARTLRVLHTPGHSAESISIYDEERRQLFAGDFISPGPLLAWLPGSDLDDYRETARTLVDRIAPDTRILAGHRDAPPGAPTLFASDLVALRDALDAIDRGEIVNEGGFWLHQYPVNQQRTMWIEVDLPAIPSLY